MLLFFFFKCIKKAFSGLKKRLELGTVFKNDIEEQIISGFSQSQQIPCYGTDCHGDL